MFKSALIYEFTDDHVAPSQADIEAALAKHECGQLMSQEITRSGFTPFHSKLFTFQLDGLTMFTLLTKSRDIPASVLANEIRERREAFESREGRWPSTRERTAMKEEAIECLLPRTFVTEKKTRAYIDHKQNLIVIDAGSSSRSEEVLALLRKALETLPVRMWSPDLDPRYVMTSWLRSCQLPTDFGQGYAVDLDSRDAGEAKLRDIALNTDEVKTHLDNYRMVSKIALKYREVGFNLSDWMQITGIKPTDTYKAALDGEDMDDRLACELIMFAGWIRDLKSALDVAMSEEGESNV